MAPQQDHLDHGQPTELVPLCPEGLSTRQDQPSAISPSSKGPAHSWSQRQTRCSAEGYVASKRLSDQRGAALETHLVRGSHVTFHKPTALRLAESCCPSHSSYRHAHATLPNLPPSLLGAKSVHPPFPAPAEQRAVLTDDWRGGEGAAEKWSTPLAWGEPTRLLFSRRALSDSNLYFWEAGFFGCPAHLRASLVREVHTGPACSLGRNPATTNVIAAGKHDGDKNMLFNARFKLA